MMESRQTRLRSSVLLRGCVLGVLVLALSAPRWGPMAQAQATRPHLVASFSILADVAQRVAGDSADVESLIPLGSNPHSYEVGAQDIVRLSEADAVLVVGMGYEAGLTSVIEEAARDRVLVVSECVPVRAVPEGVVLDHAHEGEDHEQSGYPDTGQALDCASAAPEIAAQFGFGDDGGALPGTLGALAAVDCDHLRCDPHVWTDPVNVAWWALAIRDRLSSLDPAHADDYEANARAILEELGLLHAEITAQMVAIPQANRLLVTNHVVFSYFAARYGLTMVGVVLPGGSTTSEPSVQDVMALIETIQALDVSVIFTETVVSDDLAREIAGEAGITTVPLLTESLGEPESEAGTYLGYMRTNAARIAGALGGS